MHCKYIVCYHVLVWCNVMTFSLGELFNMCTRNRLFQSSIGVTMQDPPLPASNILPPMGAPLTPPVAPITPTATPNLTPNVTPAAPTPVTPVAAARPSAEQVSVQYVLSLPGYVCVYVYRLMQLFVWLCVCGLACGCGTRF